MRKWKWNESLVWRKRRIRGGDVICKCNDKVGRRQEVLMRGDDETSVG
jgi:hypothetical protein